jgi:hypothetical protein
MLRERWALDWVRRLRPNGLRPLRRCRKCRRVLAAPRLAHYAPTFSPIEIPEDCRGECCEDVIGVPGCCTAYVIPSVLFVTFTYLANPPQSVQVNHYFTIDGGGVGTTRLGFEGNLSPTIGTCTRIQAHFTCFGTAANMAWEVALTTVLGGPCAIGGSGFNNTPMLCTDSPGGLSRPISASGQFTAGGGGSNGTWDITE